MSKPSILQQLPLYAIASVLGVIGLVPAAAPAHADSACTQFGFPGDFALRQSNNFNMAFTSKGTRASGPAIATAPNGSELRGTISGTITGRSVKLSVSWVNNGASRGVYNGTAGDDGMVHGVTFDAARPTSTATWDSLVPLTCIPQSGTNPGFQPIPQFPFPKF